MKLCNVIMLLTASLLGKELLAQGTQGGGVYVNDGKVTSTVVTGNQATGAGTGVSANGTSTLVNNTVADNKQVKQFSKQIGDVYEGGVIFFIDVQTRKALVVAPTEAPSNAKNFYRTWGEMGQNIPAALDVNNGKQNNDTIIASQVIIRDIDACRDNELARLNSHCTGFKLPADTVRRAAHWCKESKDNGKTDWFLPSREQLKKLYVAKTAVNATLSTTPGATTLGSGYYWSSTQANAYEAWYVFFDNGETNMGPKSNTANVRAIREFSF